MCWVVNSSRISKSKKLYPYCLILVGSRNRFERDFTIELKYIVDLIYGIWTCMSNKPPRYISSKPNQISITPFSLHPWNGFWHNKVRNTLIRKNKEILGLYFYQPFFGQCWPLWIKIIIWQLSFQSQLISFLQKTFFEISLQYIIINASNKGICVEFERKKQHNIGFPSFKLPASTKNLLWPVKYLFRWFRYMITRLYGRVHLSIYSARALIHKYFVASFNLLWREVCTHTGCSVL